MNLSSDATELASVAIQTSRDVVTSRSVGKKQAEALGFSARDVIKVSTATSELARNIVQHAKAPGKISFFKCQARGQSGIGILAADEGEGMANADSILSQSSSLMSGGLYGTKRIADDFKIHSKTGRGTRVQLVKWTS